MSSRRPPHPGKILKERFLDPLGITPYRLAKSIGVPTRRVSELVRGNRSLSLDTAIRLGLYFDVPPVWWLEMQARHDTQGVPLVDELRMQVTPYKGLADVLVTSEGVRLLGPKLKQASHPVLVKVPDELLERLKSQAALEPPHAPRTCVALRYSDGTAALVGSET
ncbi:MAG: HigA family addiction module antidote protein [Bradymonadales bacterium]|nr:HigA family addiction module antidote protein [Bradymonadales bacterium]